MSNAAVKAALWSVWRRGRGVGRNEEIIMRPDEMEPDDKERETEERDRRECQYFTLKTCCRENIKTACVLCLPLMQHQCLSA